MNRSRRSTFSCSHCSKSFPNELTLSRHNKLYHSGNFKLMSDSNTEIKSKEKKKISENESSPDKKSCLRKTKKRILIDSDSLSDEDAVSDDTSFKSVKVKKEKHVEENTRNSYTKCDDTNFKSVKVKKEKHAERNRRKRLNQQEECYTKIDIKQEVNTVPSVDESVNMQEQQSINLQCSKCKEQFSDKLRYNIHLATHIEECNRECASCMLLFKTNEALEWHIEEHSKDATHCCEVCSEAFFHEDGLKRHSGIHSGAKPYRCYQCREKFNDRVARYFHVARCHLLWCSVCEITFLDSKLYQEHMQEHSTRIEYSAESREIKDGFYPNSAKSLVPLTSDSDSATRADLNQSAYEQNDNAVVDLPLDIDMDAILKGSSILTNFNCPDIPKFDSNSQEYNSWLNLLIEQCRTAKYPLEQALYMKILSARAQLIEALLNPTDIMKTKEKRDLYMKKNEILSNVINEHIKAVKKFSLLKNKGN